MKLEQTTQNQTSQINKRKQKEQKKQTTPTKPNQTNQQTKENKNKTQTKKRNKQTNHNKQKKQQTKLLVQAKGHREGHCISKRFLGLASRRLYEAKNGTFSEKTNVVLHPFWLFKQGIQYPPVN